MNLDQFLSFWQQNSFPGLFSIGTAVRRGSGTADATERDWAHYAVSRQNSNWLASAYEGNAKICKILTGKKFGKIKEENPHLQYSNLCERRCDRLSNPLVSVSYPILAVTLIVMQRSSWMKI